jgi:hypothetical protein
MMRAKARRPNCRTLDSVSPSGAGRASVETLDPWPARSGLRRVQPGPDQICGFPRARRVMSRGRCRLPQARRMFPRDRS